MRRFPKRILFGTLLVLAGLGAPALAVAGDDPLCKSTQAANDLRSCVYCREVKTILSDPAFEGITFEVTALRMGATIHMEAKTAEGQLLLQDFVARMWGTPELDEHEKVCDYCLKRHQQLQHVIVDWNAGEDGIELVLISQEPKFAQWALSDARETQSWVLSSADN